MKKTIICLLLVVNLLNISVGVAHAGWVYNNGEMILTPDSYTEDGKIKVRCLFYEMYPDIKLYMELPKIDMSLPTLEFMGEDDKFVRGTLTYTNRDKIMPGIFDLKWAFVPSDDKYEIITGYLRYEVYAEDSDRSKGKIEIDLEKTEDVTTPSLTATSVLLGNDGFYDINLNNKISNSKYNWSSSNPKVAKVNEKNGKVYALKEGKSTISCEIILPDNTVQILTSEVTVGFDENAPLLTETTLDLNKGDKFDIDVENKIAKSKYKWVSSDRNIVKVNSSNGIVTAIGVGEAYVTCTIVVDMQVIVLRCEIIIT